MDYMARALELADLARGRTSPNPAVGAVVVRDGQIVGEGYTQPPGGPHAEVVALRQAGDLARGATLYTTLEPCCHQGRTPPCTRAIVAAGIAEVCVAVLDPNPLVQGGGCQALEMAGIRVRLGERPDQASRARELIEDFAKHVLTGRPFVVAKWAMSLDGKIAARTGDSKWITGPAARELAHELRDVVGAVLVGVNTVLLDDPQLTVRLPVEKARRPARPQPWRVVVDSRGRTPLEAKLLGPELADRTIVATTAAAPEPWRRAVEARGARALVLPEQAGRVDLGALLDALGEMDVTAVLVEGGGALLGSFLDSGLVDKACAFVAPRIIGGAAAISPVGGLGAPSVAAGYALRDVRVERVEDDVLIVGYPVRAEEDACSPA